MAGPEKKSGALLKGHEAPARTAGAKPGIKRILMVAFQYPPFHGSSGVERAFHFSRFLPGHGWEPTVLTASPRAYSQLSDERLSMLPSDVRVVRAPAMDATRRLSFRGRYPLWLALPDPWWSWWFGAMPLALQLARKVRPQLIWTTFPIPTAHLIGLTLHRVTGLPWVADFRDSMTEAEYPKPRAKWRVLRWVEKQTVMHCAGAVFTTAGAKRMYEERYPGIPSSRWSVIENGYDEDSFSMSTSAPTPRSRGEKLVLVHSGVLYPWERDPRPFFKALSRLRVSGEVDSRCLEIVLRGTGHDKEHMESIRNQGVADIVRLEPTLPYFEALSEMMRADGLLLFQGSNCNHQIPAKVYEYLRSGRPVFAATDPKGDTAAVLRHAGLETIIPMDSTDEIARTLPGFLAACRDGSAPVAKSEAVRSCSRRQRTAELAELLESLTDTARGSDSAL